MALYCFCRGLTDFPARSVDRRVRVLVPVATYQVPIKIALTVCCSQPRSEGVPRPKSTRGRRQLALTVAPASSFSFHFQLDPARRRVHRPPSQFIRQFICASLCHTYQQRGQRCNIHITLHCAPLTRSLCLLQASGISLSTDSSDRIVAYPRLTDPHPFDLSEPLLHIRTTFPRRNLLVCIDYTLIHQLSRASDCNATCSAVAGLCPCVADSFKFDTFEKAVSSD